MGHVKTVIGIIASFWFSRGKLFKRFSIHVGMGSLFLIKVSGFFVIFSACQDYCMFDLHLRISGSLFESFGCLLKPLSTKIQQISEVMNTCEWSKNVHFWHQPKIKLLYVIPL